MGKPIAAIDPGASGGIAWLDQELNPQCIPMPDTQGDIMQAVRDMKTEQVGTVLVEEVGGYCGAAMPGSAMFNFGKNFGFILGCLAANGIRVELVKPQRWQKEFGLGTVKASGGKGPWKRKLKEKAKQLFPSCDVTLKTSDALLLLEFGRRQNF